MTEIPTVKRHPLLDQLAADMQGIRTPGHVEVLGHRYDFVLLNPEGESWVIVHVGATTVLGFAVSRPKARFAASLTSIDGIPIEQLWPLPLNEKERAEIASSRAAERNWRRLQVLEFCESELDPNVLRAFDDEYDKLDAARKKKFEVPEQGFSRTNLSNA